MQQVYPATLQRTYARARTANATDNPFPVKSPTAAEPTGAGVIDLFRPLGGANSLRLMPFGAGADNSTLSVRVIGWSCVGDNAGNNLWVPTILAEYSAILSAAVGVAGRAVLDTERFADQVTLVTGNDGVDTSKISPANDTPAHVLVDLKGCQKVEVVFQLGTATGANALFHTL